MKAERLGRSGFPVLQQFRYGWKTIVYIDASVGTQDRMLAGGIGIVVE